MFQRMMGSRPIFIAILPIGVVAAMITGLAWRAPERDVVSAVRVDLPTITPVPTRIPATDAPTLVHEPSTEPTATNTAIPFVYSISEVPQTESGGGTKRLYIIDAGLAMPALSIHAADLRLPTPELRPQTGRYGEPRGVKYPTIHLGSDYIMKGDDIAVSPNDQAILVAVAFLKRGEYQAVAIDMAGETQMYYVNIATGNMTGEYLLCFTHLKDGSNADALRQAQSHNGQVGTMGMISTVGDGNGSLSDLHIAVIDLDVLYDFSDSTDVGSALRLLFSGTLPRMGQQYPHLFVQPETVWPALANSLAKYTATATPQP